jgi:type VI secretion system secreted protein VgrG
MQYLTNDPMFAFVSDALAEDAFGVVAFTGTEHISRCYEFDIVLVSTNKNPDLPSIVSSPARLELLPDGENSEKRVFHGMVTEFEQDREFKEFALYRAKLMPRLWGLHFIRRNQVFLDKSLPQLAEQILDDGNFSGDDYRLSLSAQYEPYEFVCQYDESHMNFLSRWMEQWGLFYFFEQDQGRERLVATDDKNFLSMGPELRYRKPKGQRPPEGEEVVYEFSERLNQLPKSLRVKDYNYRTPLLELSGKADVDESGLGEVFLFNQRARNQAESDRLATLRAEEYVCRKLVFPGKSTCSGIMVGQGFSLKEHFQSDLDGNYLALSVHHQGAQISHLGSGLASLFPASERWSGYRNSFEAMPFDVQYRPQLGSEKPLFKGVLPARVDASGTGQYAQLDEWGRYKIRLPFDTAGRGGGKASHWVRKAEPYAGGGYGMHFPLHKGAEIMLVFTGGDPDRPMIFGAAANPECPSPVNASNQTQNAITTGGNNKVFMQDKQGNEQILFHSPKADTYIKLGDIND